MVMQQQTVSESTLQGGALNGRDLAAEVVQLSDARKADLVEFLDQLAQEDAQAAIGSDDIQSSSADWSMELAHTTLESLSQDELVKVLFATDANRLELIQDIIKFAFMKPSDEEDEEEAPIVADGYDLTVFERLAMRIVGNLVADAYLENNGTFETWDNVVENVIKSLRQGGNCTYIVTTHNVPNGEIERWVHRKADAILEATA